MSFLDKLSLSIPHDDDEDFSELNFSYTQKKFNNAVEIHQLTNKYGNSAFSSEHPQAFINFFKSTHADNTHMYNTFDKLDQYGIVMVRHVCYGGYGEKIDKKIVYNEDIKGLLSTEFGNYLILADDYIIPGLYKQYTKNKGTKHVQIFKKSGYALKYLKAFLLKLTSTLGAINRTLTEYILNTAYEDIDPLDIFDKYEKEIITELIQTYSQMVHYDNPELIIGITMQVGVPTKAKTDKRLNTPMKESENSTCILEFYKEKLIPRNFTEEQLTIPEINQSWYTHGMMNEDVKFYNEKLAISLKQSLRVKIFDRLNDKPIFECNKKISGSNYIDLKLYKYNFHASSEYLSNDEMYFAHKENKTKPVYLNVIDMRELFSQEYKKHRAVLGNFTGNNVDIYSFCTENKVYYLNEYSSGIDRSKFPTALTKSSINVSDFSKIHPKMDKSHSLSKYYTPQYPIELKETNDETSIKEYQMTGMARGFFVGRTKIYPIEHTFLKMDRNGAFRNYHQCDYAKDKDGRNWMPSIPWGSMYKCDNSILDVEGICGSLFVTIHTPPFMINTDKSVEENLTFLKYNKGRIYWIEALYLRDMGADFTIHGIIPSFKVYDTMKDSFKKIIKSETDPKIGKLEVNKLIGKFRTNVNMKVDITVNPEECENLEYEYRKQGRAPVVKSIHPFSVAYDLDETDSTTLPETYIITSIDNSTIECSKYPHLHDHIIACYRVDMMQQMKNLIDHGCEITGFRVDSITFLPLKDFHKTYATLTNKYVTNGNWKWEKYEAHKDFKNYSTVKPQMDFEEDLKNAKTFNPVFRHKTLAITGGAGYGKTHLIKESFNEDDCIFVAWTHSAARQLNPKAITFSRFKILVKSRSYILKLKSHIVFDEISMIPVHELIELMNDLKNLTGSSEDFGGFGIIFVGDPAQIPPVKGKNIFQTKTIKYHEHKLTEDKRSKSQFFIPLFRYVRALILSGDTKGYDTFIESLFDKRSSNHKKFCLTKDPDDLFDPKANWTLVCYTNESVNYANENYYKMNKDCPELRIYISETIPDVCYNNQEAILRNGKVVINGKEYEDIKYTLAFSVTAHKIQGKTIRHPLLIHMAGMDSRMLYTCITRLADPDNHLKIIITKEAKDQYRAYRNKMIKG